MNPYTQSPEADQRYLASVLQPGGYLLSFGGTRTFHRMGTAIEDAGFEIRDCLSWLYGQGFPKHKWQLKPGWEPIILARKPSRKSSPLNVEGCRIEGAGAYTNHTRKVGNEPGWNGKHTGEVTQHSGRWPANVVLTHSPECRIVGARRVKGGKAIKHNTPTGKIQNQVYGPMGNTGVDAGYVDADGTEGVEQWECVPDCAVALLDAQSGECGSSLTRNYPDQNASGGRGIYSKYADGKTVTTYADTGGASRFFYTAKASRREREAGLEGMPAKQVTEADKWATNDRRSGTAKSPTEWKQKPAGNHHPTVKPLALMRWLCRLVTPPNGRILDPFMGSGTTGCAAALEGFDFVGIEKEAEYVDIAQRRIAHWNAHRNDPDLFDEEPAA